MKYCTFASLVLLRMVGVYVPVQWNHISCHDGCQYFINIFFTCVTTSPSKNPCKVITSAQRKYADIWRQLITNQIPQKVLITTSQTHLNSNSSNLNKRNDDHEPVWIYYYLTVVFFLHFLFCLIISVQKMYETPTRVLKIDE